MGREWGRLPKGEKLIPTGDLRDDDGSAENASKTLSFVVFFFDCDGDDDDCYIHQGR